MLREGSPLPGRSDLATLVRTIKIVVDLFEQLRLVVEDDGTRVSAVVLKSNTRSMSCFSRNGR